MILLGRSTKKIVRHFEKFCLDQLKKEKTNYLAIFLSASVRKLNANYLTQLIRKLIDQASTNITLLWVLSHADEAADAAAKEALNEETHHTETYPPQDLIAWIKEKHEQEQQKKNVLRIRKKTFYS
jgi:hypothetical protein